MWIEGGGVTPFLAGYVRVGEATGRPTVGLWAVYFVLVEFVEEGD